MERQKQEHEVIYCDFGLPIGSVLRAVEKFVSGLVKLGSLTQPWVSSIVTNLVLQAETILSDH